MRYGRFTIRLAICLALFVAVGCKSKTQRQTVEPEASSPSPTPTPATALPQTPSPTPTPEEGHLNLTGLTQTVGPAVILVTVFDSSGKLLRTGTGFFVSDAGRIITTWQTVDGALNAVAKTANGAIYNITGVLASSTKLNLAVLNAEAEKVPYLALDKTTDTAPDANSQVAVLGSALSGPDGRPVEATISATEPDEKESGLELTGAVPTVLLGAPVINANGELIGVVTETKEKDSPSTIVRPVSALRSIADKVEPNATTRWPGEPKPTPTPRPRLVQTPRPIYPSDAHFRDGVARTGRYRLNFDVNGAVKNIQILQSAGSEVLDRAALKGLEQWKCEPGREGFIIIPLTFQSR